MLRHSVELGTPAAFNFSILTCIGTIEQLS